MSGSKNYLFLLLVRVEKSSWGLSGAAPAFRCDVVRQLQLPSACLWALQQLQSLVSYLGCRVRSVAGSLVSPTAEELGQNPLQNCGLSMVNMVTVVRCGISLVPETYFIVRWRIIEPRKPMSFEYPEDDRLNIQPGSTLHLLPCGTISSCTAEQYSTPDNYSGLTNIAIMTFS